MLKQRSMIFALLAFLACAALPLSARAQNAPDWKNPDCTQVNKALQDAELHQAQQLAQNTNNFYAYMPPIDLGAYQCLTQISNALGQLQGISSLGLSAIIDQAITNQVLQMISSTCSAAVSTINSVENLVYSQVNRLCIPLPNIGLNISAPSLPSAPTCSGTPLFTLTPMKANTADNPTIWQWFGLKSGQTSTGATP